jgi:hypothetical protein
LHGSVVGARCSFTRDRKCHQGVWLGLKTSTELLLRLSEKKRERDRNHSVLTDGKQQRKAGVLHLQDGGQQNRRCMVAGVVDGERPMCFLWSRSSGHATILMGSELSGPGDDLPCDCVLHIALFFSYAVGADADGTVELAAAASDFVCRCVKEGCIYIHIYIRRVWAELE